MIMSNYSLRHLDLRDYCSLKEVYIEAICSQGQLHYTADQIEAWSSLAFLPGLFDQSLREGKGWVSLCQDEVVAFAIRYPSHRLALLYCRGNYSRKGHATALLSKVEEDAKNEGVKRLITEASFLSQPLLIKLGWLIKSKEKILIRGISFYHFRMEKLLV